MGNPTLANETAQKLVSLLEHAVSQNSDPLFWYVAQVGADLVTLLDQAETESVDKIIDSIRQKYQPVAPEQKTSLMLLLCRLYNRASESERSNVNGLLISDFLWNLSIGQALEVLQLRSDPEYNTLPWDQICARLAERLVAGPDVGQADEHITLLSSKLSQHDPEYLTLLLVKLLQRQEIQQAVTLVEQGVQYLPKGNRGKRLLTPVLEATLNISGPHGQPENHELLLNFTLNLKDLHTREFEVKFDSHLLELIRNEGPLGQVGIQILESSLSQEAIPRYRYDAILSELSGWLVQQPTNIPLEEPLPQILDKIVTNKDIFRFAGSHRYKMTKWLAARQEPALPATERQNTLCHLISFGKLAREVLYDVVPRLVRQAQSEGEETTQGPIIDALLTLYRNNKPQDQDLWTDLNQFRLDLLNGDGNQKTLGRKLDREMRKIRQEQAKSVTKTSKKT